MDDHEQQRARSNSGRSQGSQSSKIPRPAYNGSHRPPMPQQPLPPSHDPGLQQYSHDTRTPPKEYASRGPRSGATTPRAQYGHGTRTPNNEYASQGPRSGATTPRAQYGHGARTPNNDYASQGPRSGATTPRAQYGHGTRTPTNEYASRGPRSGATTPRVQYVQSGRNTPKRLPPKPEMTRSPPSSRFARSPQPLQAPGPSHQNSISHKSYLASLSRRTSASHYVSDLDPEDLRSRKYDLDDRVSEISSEDEDEEEAPRTKRTSHIVSQASLGKKVRPTIMTMGSWASGPKSPLSGNVSSQASPASKHPSMEMLSAAIKQAQSTSPTPSGHRPQLSTSQSDPTLLRMPFQRGDSPLASPTSVYTDCTVPHRHDSVPVSAFNQALRGRASMPLTIPEQDSSDNDSSRPTTRLQHVTTHSPARTEKSTARLIGLGSEQKGMSDKIPASKRPPQLNINAVRDMEARGSTTSLAELIRRATKVASNLDRGKTASRMGHLDMFGVEKEKPKKHPLVRDSTYSEVLAAFPNPGSPGSTVKARQTMWPSSKKHHLHSKTSLGHLDEDEKPRRKCFGLSPPIFVLVVLIILAVIAAAVLVPVFLVVIPKQKAAEAARCSAKPCLNGGIDVNVNNDCSCICVSGYTGSDCSIASDPDCVSQTLSDGESTYKNATMGSSIMPLLTNQGSNNIPLNSTILLGTFSSNNVTCAGENSLVTFNSFSTKRKRFVIFGDLQQDFKPIQLPSPISLAPVPTKRAEFPEKRQNTNPGSAQTSNGIVFAHSTQSDGKPATTASFGPASTASDGSASATSNSPAPTGSSSGNGSPPTDAQASFAGAAVLYVLEKSNSIQTAALANQNLRMYFQEGGVNSGKTTVQVADKITIDFSKMALEDDGTTVGGA